MTGLHILQVTDSAAEAALVARALETAGYTIQSECVANAEQLHAALAKQRFELTVANNQTAALTPGKVLAILQRAAPDLPCIVVSDQIGKEAVELLKAGACDFILKDDFARFGAAVESALQIPRQRAAQRQAEKALRESEEKFSRAFHISPDSINLNRLEDGVWVDLNEGFTASLGYTKEEVLGRSSVPGDLGVWINQEDRDRMVAELKAKGEVIGFEAPFRSKDGRVVIGLMSARILQINGQDCILSFTRNVTELKQAEAEREATIRLLRLCNKHDNTSELVSEVLLFFQELTGCEAIALRLREGPDFPYYETRGFSPEFVRAECHLCSFDQKGQVNRDAEGKSVLDCLCGQVLRSQFDSSKPFFTKNGSFWTNHMSDMRASESTTDLQTEQRYRCDDDGYESVGLIPLRGHAEPIGLLQINDRRTDRFTMRQIELIEGLADHVAIALLKLDSERAHRSSEEHLRTVLDTSEAGYFFIDPEGCFQRVNPAWLHLHGYERAEEIIGQHFSLTQVKTDLPAATKVVRDLLTGVKMPAREFSRRRKDDSVGYHTFSAHVVREQGRVLGIEGFLIDTTGLHQIREEYEMLFGQMLDGFSLHAMVFDDQGKPVDYVFLAVNPAFEKMTGLKADDVIGKSVLTVMPKIEHKWIELYGEVVRTGVPKRFEEFATAMGKHFEVLAFRPQKGQFACLIQDITNRKQLEMQLLQAQKMEAIGQLAGGVAHDFNNILSATMMHLSLLLRTPELKPTMKTSLKELETDIKRATGVIRQLLLFSRRQVMHIGNVDLNDLLTNLLKMLQRLIGEHIDLGFNPSSAPLWIEADSGMIEQIVMNLCVNARDAMPTGGQLTITAYSTSLDSTKVLGDPESRSGEFICLSVTDTGCGMDADTLKHIFEPFFTTKGPEKGTGLGLATVYSIVKQHRGWIIVHSTMSGGTTFRVFLPAAIAPIEATTQADPSPIIQGGAEGILVVEDDSGFRNMVAMSLKVLGYRVFEAADGRAALAVWEKHAAEITILFADQVLPGGISGLELCTRLHSAKPTLRRIISTGYPRDRVNPAQLATAGIDFLPKPFTAEALANAVRQCLDRKESE